MGTNGLRTNMTTECVKLVVDTLRRASAREAFVVKKYIIFFLENDSWQDPYSSAGIVYPFEAALKLQFGPSTH